MKTRDRLEISGQLKLQKEIKKETGEIFEEIISENDPEPIKDTK